jgi:hypothetical protein
MATEGGPNTVTNGLVLSLDAGNTKSYSGLGTTWFDKSGYGNNGTLVNGTTYSSLNGGSLVFDGVNDNALILRPIQDDFTLSCWVKTNQGGGLPTQWYNGYGLLDCEGPGYQNDFGLSMRGGRILFGVGNPDTTIYSPLVYNDNKWHHAICTRTISTGAMSLYVDSTLVATGTGQTGSLTSVSSMRIGALQTSINFFSGNISQVQIYNIVLSAQEVLQNYNATKSRFNL